MTLFDSLLLRFIEAPGYANTAGHTLRDFAGAGSASLLAFLRGGVAAASESDEDESSLEDESLLLSEDVPATDRALRQKFQQANCCMLSCLA